MLKKEVIICIAQMIFLAVMVLSVVLMNQSWHISFNVAGPIDIIDLDTNRPYLVLRG